MTTPYQAITELIRSEGPCTFDDMVQELQSNCKGCNDYQIAVYQTCKVLLRGEFEYSAKSKTFEWDQL